MIKVNEKEMEWHSGLSFADLFVFLGYRIKNPPVVVRVTGKIIKKNDRKNYVIKDNAAIDVIKTLYGG